jgi:hypothetical protein
VSFLYSETNAKQTRLDPSEAEFFALDPGRNLTDRVSTGL